MKFLTFTQGSGARLGSPLPDGDILDLTRLLGPQAPTDVMALIEGGGAALHAICQVLKDRTRHAANTVCASKAVVLAPLPRPGKNVFCVGRNYRAHIMEGNRAAGRDPNDFPVALELFTKPWTTVIGTGASIKRHAKLTRQLDYEVELAIVIGKTGTDIPREQALEHVFGYTIVNDVTARDLQKRHGQWFKGKSLDTFCPMGPWVVHRSIVPDPQNLRLVMEVNGEVRQDANTSDMLFDVPSIIEQVSAGLTLHAGDVIATGTPSGVGFAMQPSRCLEVGDVMRARITGLGELVNCVVE